MVLIEHLIVFIRTLVIPACCLLTSWFALRVTSQLRFSFDQLFLEFELPLALRIHLDLLSEVGVFLDLAVLRLLGLDFDKAEHQDFGVLI